MIDCAAGQDVNNNRDGDDVGQHVCLCGIHWRRHWFKSGSMDQTRGLGQCTERSALIMECRIKIATNNAFWPLSCLPAPAWSRPLPHQLIVEDGGDKVPLWPDCCRRVGAFVHVPRRRKVLGKKYIWHVPFLRMHELRLKPVHGCYDKVIGFHTSCWCWPNGFGQVSGGGNLVQLNGQNRWNMMMLDSLSGSFHARRVRLCKKSLVFSSKHCIIARVKRDAKDKEPMFSSSLKKKTV